MPRLRVIDLETTGMEPPAEIVEFGRADVVADGVRVTIERPMTRLYRPLNGIPPEALAVHHITEADFTADTPVCTPDRLRLAVWGGSAPDVLVAHNAEFEQKFILPFGKHKGAVWADAPVDYLEWMVGQADMDADAIWHARRELARRKG
jgi:DNA polymerase III epsilon subunit-like protein